MYLEATQVFNSILKNIKMAALAFLHIKLMAWVALELLYIAPACPRNLH